MALFIGPYNGSYVYGLPATRLGGGPYGLMAPRLPKI